MGAVFLGVDVGTSAVRTVAVTEDGTVAAAAAAPLRSSRRADGLHEQDPAHWWSGVCATIRSVARDLRGRGHAADALRAVSVDGTSGTLVSTGADGLPVRPAIMYDDRRAEREAAMLNRSAGSARFGASWSLAKALWVLRHEPDVFERTRFFLHPADWVAGRLCGEFGVSDYGNSLKMGWDLEAESWPAWLAGRPGLFERLPEVTVPGTRIGSVTAPVGLPRGLKVIAGTTDGVAGCIASGLNRVGDFSVTLGTTLVFKGLSASIPSDPAGLTYTHKLPGGLWLPGAASSTGGAWIPARFAGADLGALDERASALLPSSHIAYPLVGRGERFPFRSSSASGFVEPAAEDLVLYAANLQGTACLERLGYEVLDGVLGCEDGTVFSAGGGSRSDVWMQLRADVCGRVFHRPACTEAAFGTAVLAAGATVFDSLGAAVESMTRVERTFYPRPRPAFEQAYARFLAALQSRGYLMPPAARAG